MKYLLYIFVAILVSGCTGNSIRDTSVVNLHLSPDFQLAIPEAELSDANVIVLNDIGIKFSDESLLTVTLITHQSENLSPSFDLSKFPEYIFGISIPEGYSKELVESFSGSSQAMKYRLGNYSVTTMVTEDKQVYIAKGTENAVLFVVRESVSDQILGVYLDRYTDEQLDMILKGLR